MYPTTHKDARGGQQYPEIEALEAMIPGLAVLVDVSEQPTYRPQDDETQKKHHSGKAKRHNVKTQYAATYDCTILQTSTAMEGSRHDFAIFKESVPTFPESLPHEHWVAPDEQFQRRLKYLGDSAYTGMEKTVSQHTSSVQKTKARKEADDCRKSVRQGTPPAKSGDDLRPYVIPLDTYCIQCMA